MVFCRCASSIGIVKSGLFLRQRGNFFPYSMWITTIVPTITAENCYRNGLSFGSYYLVLFIIRLLIWVVMILLASTMIPMTLLKVVTEIVPLFLPRSMLAASLVVTQTHQDIAHTLTDIRISCIAGLSDNIVSYSCIKHAWRHRDASEYVESIYY